jgi:hypothetical protein
MSAGKVLPYHSSVHGETLTRLSAPSMLRPPGESVLLEGIPRTRTTLEGIES